MSSGTITELADLVCKVWDEAAEQATMSEQTASKFGGLAVRFAAFAAASGVTAVDDVTPRLCAAFINAPGRDRTGAPCEPALATRHLRRANLRVFFRTARAVGVGIDDPTVDIVLPLRGPRGAIRLLTDTEAETVRFFSDRGCEHRHSVTVALLLAGARTAELGWIQSRDVNLSAGTVWVHGSMKYAARALALRPGDLPWFHARLQHLDDAEALLAAPVSGDAARRQSLIGMTVGAVLKSAGLGDDTSVTPTSLTSYAAAAAHAATGRIEDAAIVTGCRSLDSAATLIGYDWQPEDWS